MTPRINVPKELPGVELTTSERLLKFLVYGLTGAGKTRLALSFAQDARFSPVLWLDSTGGTTGVLDAARAAGASVRDYSDSKSILAYCDWLIANPGAYKSVILDDFSESFGLTKESVAVDKGRRTADNLEGHDYAAVYDRTRTVFRRLKRLASPIAGGGAGMHVMVTCWPEREAHPTKDGVEMLVPRFSGKFGYEVPGYFDVVAYLEASTKRGAGSTGLEFINTMHAMHSKALVRDRFGLLPASMELPTADAIMNYYSKGDTH